MLIIMYSARVVVVEESNEYVVFELKYCCCELHFFVRLRLPYCAAILHHFSPPTSQHLKLSNFSISSPFKLKPFISPASSRCIPCFTTLLLHPPSSMTVNSTITPPMTSGAPPKPKPKLTGRDFYNSLGSPKTIVAPMVEQSELVR